MAVIHMSQKAQDELALFIRSLRGDLSLRDAAEKVGISHTYLSQLEKGQDPRSGNEISPTPEVLKMIADGYECSYHDLMFKAGYLTEANDTEPLLSNAAKQRTVIFGERLKELRKQRGMTQEQVAAHLGFNSKATISGYESGSTPSVDSLITFADLFGVSTDYLLGRTDQSTGQKETPASDPLLHQVLDKLARMERDIADLKNAVEIGEKVMKKIEEHGVDIRLLKKLAAKE